LIHPNVVQFLGIYVRGPDKYIVTEYLSLGSLSTVLTFKKSELKPLDLLEMSKHAAAGMIYISEYKQFVHRDLALRNLLVTSKEGKYVVKVADLGLSRSTSEKGFYQSQDAVFPVKWTAPESIQYRKFTSKSDVWSFGIVLWEIYSFGATPYPGMNNEQTADQVQRGYRLSSPEGTPESIYNIMLK
jgi:serine/threonine protein kinase